MEIHNALLKWLVIRLKLNVIVMTHISNWYFSNRIIQLHPKENPARKKYKLI